ncbi:hypothetical protein ACTJJ7_28000, partial [Phyllobacterium sp. 22229]|uniref:hypothetical protein n=1 Tax=Phyllobacterium sp. 22229 TaxID=3453895 RepID=UPI003F848ADE
MTSIETALSLRERLLKHADDQIDDNLDYIRTADALMREAAAALPEPAQDVTPVAYRWQWKERHFHPYDEVWMACINKPAFDPSKNIEPLMRISDHQSAISTQLLGFDTDELTKEASGKPFSSIKTSKRSFEEHARELLKKNGWKGGDKFSVHSVIQLMAQFAMSTERGEHGCDWPSCGCCADAACEDALSHPDFAKQAQDVTPVAQYDIAYDGDDNSYMATSASGDYVKFIDHQSAIAQLEAERDE